MPLTTSRIVRCLPALLLLSVTPATWATTAEQAGTNASAKAWFTPQRVAGDGAFCDEVLKAARAHFLTRKRWAAFVLPGAQRVELRGAKATQGPVYFDVLTHPGCGGACERYQVIASRTPGQDRETLEQLAKGLPGPAVDVELFKGRDDRYVSIGSGIDGQPDRLEVSRLNDDLTWTTCRISTGPDEAQIAQGIPAAVRSAVEAMERAAARVRQDAGWMCGSARTHARWETAMHDALQAVHYRPWAVFERVDDPTGTYDQDLQGLQRWADRGVFEHQAYEAFVQQMERSQATVATFFAQRYGLAKTQAAALSRQALQNAVSEGIRFYQYAPYPKDEAALRDAILAHRPMAEIRALPGKVDDLAVAIEYPEALAYLIEQGADVNQANAFGKTPLMYAAQYNQVQSARTLLDKGAYPNATTLIPVDGCSYSLRTTNMTALHYAARYAGPELVKLLLDRGAEPAIRARWDGEPGRTPLDWLQQYTAPGAAERNPNIADGQMAGVAALLQPASAPVLQARAQRLVLEGEKAYQAGDLKRALRALDLAINLQPGHERALADLSLVALRDGDYGLSLQAGQALIDGSRDARLVANAWHNQALACEKAGSTRYNDRLYCNAGPLYARYQAWRADPSAQRAANLVGHAVPEGGYTVASLVYDDVQLDVIKGSGPTFDGREYLYLAHPSRIVIHTERLGWKAASDTQAAPSVVEEARVLDGSQTLTVLRCDQGCELKGLQVLPAP